MSRKNLIRISLTLTVAVLFNLTETMSANASSCKKTCDDNFPEAKTNDAAYEDCINQCPKDQPPVNFLR